MTLALASWAGLAVTGCVASGVVTTSDAEKVKKDFSQEKYDEAMIKAGRGAELQREKDAAVKHGQAPDGGDSR